MTCIVALHVAPLNAVDPMSGIAPLSCEMLFRFHQLILMHFLQSLKLQPTYQALPPYSCIIYNPQDFNVLIKRPPFPFPHDDVPKPCFQFR